jgi:hypothetical protein
VSELADFQKKQYAFAAHIRDPENHAAPANVEDRRMAIYRELFFNNLHSLLSQTFPVLTKLHDKQRWRAIVRQFMVRHQAQTPYFLEIPAEFLAFLKNEYERDADDFPFLTELAHYEWVELALSISQETNTVEADPDGDLLNGVPVRSVLCWTFAYRFPVHRINTTYQPQEPGEQPSILAICRQANDDLDFMELNPATARLLEMIGDNDSLTGRELLQDIARELEYPDIAALEQHGTEAMQQMLDAEILLGTRKV